jgi:hypothetical protein
MVMSLRSISQPTVRARVLAGWVLLLLLQTALPWLASQAALVRGVSLVEVCTVYGMRTVAVPASDDAAEHVPAAHEGDRCLLQALGYGPVAVAQIDAVAATPTLPHPAERQAAAPHDAAARWAALRKHGPPAV